MEQEPVRDAPEEEIRDDLVKPTFKNGMYGNPWTDTWEDRTFFDVLKHAWKNGSFFSIPHPMTQQELDQKIPVEKTDLEKLKSPDPNEIQVTWIGHASALVQMEGVSFLTDPVFCERASPVQFAGPKRYRPTSFNLKDLPPIDFVVISHDHYDHLDLSVVTHLGNSCTWFVPIGQKEWFVKQGVTNVKELTWWEKARFNDNIEVVSTPCQHWSKRGALNRCTSLWSSWAIIGKEKRVWFSGDTGYCSVFKTIGNQYGPFDLSLIAIGAYCPRDFMRPQHVDPDEAVAIHQELKSKFSIGIHWGTFALTSEPEDEPPKRLKEALQKNQLREDEFIATNIGQIFTVPH